MIGTTVSHYRILEKLGDGATAVVYLADDLALGRAVALKLVPPGLSNNNVLITRFQHEARTASSLNHPNICTIYEIAEHDGRQFIVMELLEGHVLSRLLSGRPLDAYRAIELATQIADGLEAAHKEGIVHRDIKPPNIFVTNRDQVKILDFGLAMLVPSGTVGSEPVSPVKNVRSIGGTVPYMSPEQTRGEPLDPRSDLFSVGIVMYEMVTGRRAFDGIDQASIIDAIGNHSPRPPRELNPAVPIELERIIGKALEKNRGLRFQTASDLRADLQRLKRDFDSNAAVMVRSQTHPGDSARGLSPARASAPPLRAPSRSALVAMSVLAGGTLMAFMGVRSFRSGPQTIAVAPLASVAPAMDIQLPSSTPDGSEVGGDPPPVVRAAAVPSAANAIAHPDGVALVGRSIPVPLAAPKTLPETKGNNTDAAGPSLQAAWAAQELRVAKAQIDAKLFDQGLMTLKSIVAKEEAGDAAIDAYFMMASIQEQRGNVEDAMATYLEIISRDRDHARVPEAMFLMAQSTLRSHRQGKETEARRLFGDVAASYPQSSWAPRALLARGDLEDRLTLYQRDDVLGTSVPAALVTYRDVATRYPANAVAETALWKLGQIYADIKRYDLAARAFSDLATQYPGTQLDAWFKAADLFDKRLNDDVSAQAAYTRVPASSPHFKDAQKRLHR